MEHNSNTNTEAVKGLNLSTIKAEAEAKAVKATEAKAKASEARKAVKTAEKAVKKATKEAEKAEAIASDCKPSEATAKKAEAKAKRAEAKKAEGEAKKAQAVKEKAEASENKAVAEATEAREAVKVAVAREKVAIASLTIKAEAVRKGLNASIRALLESACDSNTDIIELEALLSFVGREIPKGEIAIRKAVQAVTKAEILSNYRAFSSFVIASGDSFKVAKPVRSFPDCNTFVFEESTIYSIGNIFRSPALNKMRGVKQFKAEAGVFYEKVKGVYSPISKAEAEARIKTAKMQAEAEASRKAEAERQAEADRKAGEKARLQAEAEARKERAKAEGKKAE